MPNNSARDIHDVAEVINRLWGSPTPGGRLYPDPAPIRREMVAVGWVGEREGRSLVQLRPDQIPARAAVDARPWTYLVLLAVPDDRGVEEFDARYELTGLPCDLLWGPGGGDDAVTWWKSANVEEDEVEYLDRLFAIRVDEGKVHLAQHPAIVLSLTKDRRGGEWH